MAGAPNASFDEVSVKKTFLLSIVMTTAAFIAAGCHREQKTNVPVTQTIAPVAAQPAPTGTDAMTQTVEVEDSRSEEDGGTTTATSATSASTKKTTTKTTKTAKTPPKKKK